MKNSTIKAIFVCGLFTLMVNPTISHARVHHKKDVSAQPTVAGNTAQPNTNLSTQPAAADLAQYQQVAAANNDELSWLGQMPAVWSEDVYSQQLSAILLKLDQVLGGLSAASVDATRFDCKAAQWSNGMFNQPAVVDYVKQAAGQVKGKQWVALVNAAQNGNALARFQVYAALSKSGTGLVERYRALQLLDWLSKNQVGEFYYYYVQRLSASGYYAGHEPSVDAPEYVFAAQHGSYSAMNTVGNALRQSKDAKQQKIGQRMLSCGNAIMPGVFNK